MIKTKGPLAGLNKTVTPVKSWVRKTLKTWIPVFAAMTVILTLLDFRLLPK
jgi:hypothetical protein